jgi:hypothetical protein
MLGCERRRDVGYWKGTGNGNRGLRYMVSFVMRQYVACSCWLLQDGVCLGKFEPRNESHRLSWCCGQGGA